MLDMFSLNHYIWFLVAIILFYAVYRLLRDLSDKKKFIFLFSLSVLAWIIHFSRIWLKPDVMPHEIFFVDLCGFSTMVYPFFMLSKKKILKDYMYFVGGIFALSSLAYPNNIAGDPVFIYNTIRFFFAHWILIAIPLLLVLWKLHTPNIRNIGYMYLFVIVIAWYNMALSALFVELGYVNTLINYMGLWGNTESVYNLSEIIAPFFRYSTVVAGETITKPIPFFYMLPTLTVVFVPLWVLMSLPFRKKEKQE
jgi:hypothetical protein